MTQRTKGPTQRTPAKPGGSIEQKIAAVSVREECLEQLRRIAEDAQNFQVRLFHAPADSALSEWSVFLERKSAWVRSAADSLRAYVEAIREIFMDHQAMAKETNENLPLFQPHLASLTATIRGIYERAAEGATSDDDGERRRDPREAERMIQDSMAYCELQIRRAISGPFKSVDAWIARELNRRAEASPPPPRQSKLPPKKINLSSYAKWIDATGLTELQRQVYSLRLEHRLSIREIAKRLRKDPTTIREHLAAAFRRIDAPKGAHKQGR